VEAGVTLKLDSGITLNGGDFYSTKEEPYCFEINEPIVVVNTGGTLVMRERSAIIHDDSILSCSNNNANGVLINGGTFIMNGGEICNNNAEIGGGVYVKSGTFTMNDGVIDSNEAQNGGGGVYVENGTFTMYGGQIGDTYYSNSASISGGGVYVENGTFTMYGGKINNNKARGFTDDYKPPINGGGVYVAGTFTMEKGEIFGNYDDYLYYPLYGGGVFVDDTGIFNMKGGNIYGNFAYYYGGGVYVLTLGTFTKSGGTIYGGSIDPKSNTTSEGSGESGNAVLVLNIIEEEYDGYVEYTPLYRRETTAGPNDSLSYNGTTGKTTGNWIKNDYEP